MKKNRVAIEMDHLKKKKRWAYFEQQINLQAHHSPVIPDPSANLPGTSGASQHCGLLRLGGGRERLGRRDADAGGESKTLGASKGSVAKGALDGWISWMGWG